MQTQDVEIARHSSSAAIRMEAQGKKWQDIAELIATGLQSEGVFKGLIEQPGITNGNKKGQVLTIKKKTLVDSLQRYVEEWGHAYKPETHIDIVQSYWAAIAQVLPDPFCEPKDHNIQRTLGVVPINWLLKDVLWIMAHYKGNGDPTNSENFIPVIQQAFTDLRLPNDTAVQGVGVWVRGGKAQGLSNFSGRKVIYEALKTNLPKIG